MEGALPIELVIGADVNESTGENVVDPPEEVEGIEGS